MKSVGGTILEKTQDLQLKSRTFLNKLAAGERHLSEAIRMYFLEIDPLAIHVVASCAHNIFADLLSARNKDPTVHGVLYGLFRAARDLNEGAMTEDELFAKGIGPIETVQELSEFLRLHPNFDIDEMETSAPKEFARAYWADRRRSYNYLKHADRDGNSLLDESTINNEAVILDAMNCAQHLNMKHNAEKHFFFCVMICLGHIEGNKEKPFDLEYLMADLTKDEMLALGRRNLTRAVYPDDHVYIGSASIKMKARTQTFKGKDLYTFDPAKL